jgi:hypothetical protein
MRRNDQTERILLCLPGLRCHHRLLLITKKTPPDAGGVFLPFVVKNCSSDRVFVLYNHNRYKPLQEEKGVKMIGHLRIK